MNKETDVLTGWYHLWGAAGMIYIDRKEID